MLDSIVGLYPPEGQYGGEQKHKIIGRHATGITASLLGFLDSNSNHNSVLDPVRSLLSAVLTGSFVVLDGRQRPLEKGQFQVIMNFKTPRELSHIVQEALQDE
jgi:hypothetical protein